MFGQLLLQAGADGVVRQYLPGVDLGESLLDFADEPVVVVDGSLDGFADQHSAEMPRRPAARASLPSRSGDRFTSIGPVYCRDMGCQQTDMAHSPADLKGRRYLFTWIPYGGEPQTRVWPFAEQASRLEDGERRHGIGRRDRKGHKKQDRHASWKAQF